MNALLLRDAAFRLGVAPERIFALAHEYMETPKSRKYIVAEFLIWYHENKIKPDVEWFILDILAGRVTR